MFKVTRNGIHFDKVIQLSKEDREEIAATFEEAANLGIMSKNEDGTWRPKGIKHRENTRSR